MIRKECRHKVFENMLRNNKVAVKVFYFVYQNQGLNSLKALVS